MNKLKQRHAQMDFGFYATIPRIVRTEYPEISPAQKWFYVCLKGLLGDDGTCYRTIRALVKATGFSCGRISESIPVLHTSGLIHAEKKSGRLAAKRSGRFAQLSSMRVCSISTSAMIGKQDSLGNTVDILIVVKRFDNSLELLT